MPARPASFSRDVARFLLPEFAITDLPSALSSIAWSSSRAVKACEIETSNAVLFDLKGDGAVVVLVLITSEIKEASVAFEGEYQTRVQHGGGCRKPSISSP
jgi:hypothetical protein